MIDAHNHLQDERLDPYREDLEISPCMVNGTSEADWERVVELAEKFPDTVIPNFGLHPWFVKDRSEQWESRLSEYLDRFPKAGLGEAGIDKWVRDHDIEVQEPVFERQIQIAAERDIPLTVHCLQAFGRLKDILARNPLPSTCGFLLHSYSGPLELVDDFLELGAYFSISGYFMHERKAAAREIFREIPIDRLLVETDAPDMGLPEADNPNPLSDSAINSPANLSAVYAFAAELREMGAGEFEKQIDDNFARFAGRSRHL